MSASEALRVGYLASADGEVNTGQAAVAKSGHKVRPIEASAARDFMSQVSQAAEGSVVGGYPDRTA